MELCDGCLQHSYSSLLESLSDVEWLLFSRRALPTDNVGGLQSQSDDDVYPRQSQWTAGVVRCSSVVDELFAFQLITGRVCDVCRQLSVDIEPSYILTVPLPHSHITTDVVSCLRQLTNTEQLYGIHCARCHRDQMVVHRGPGGDDLRCMEVGTRQSYRQATSVTRSNCQRRSMLHHCPQYLIIQLLRFTSCQSKLTNRVIVPYYLLLTTDLVMHSRDVAKYQLTALCCHVDSHVITSGHYVTYATTDDITWYKFDDVTVTEVDIDQQLMSQSVQQSVYVLFYRRVVSRSLQGHEVNVEQGQ